MKKLFYSSLLLVAIALVTTSCNKVNDESIDNQDQGAPAVLTVNFDNPNASYSSTRGVGIAVDESTITSGVIMVFRSGSGVLDGRASFTSIATPINVRMTAGTRDVYVVANATGSDFTTVQNVSDLYNMTNKYAFTSISSTGANLPMSGMALSQDCTAATVASPTPVSVTMNFIQSKVTVAWDLTQLNTDMASFLVTDVYLLNVHAKSDYFVTGTDNLTTHVMDYLFGRPNITGFTGTYIPGSSYTNTNNSALALANAPANSGNNFFYIHENNIVASPTIVVIQGTVSHNSVLTTYYYPIVMNGSQNATSANSSATVVRGKHYTVTATIKGFGNTDPYEPIINAALDITIVPATWMPVTITQTFN